MRSIRVFIISLGVSVLLTCGWAVAQDAAKPVVQVIIGADGSVKVIDVKTGKEVPSVVAKGTPKDPARAGKQPELELARIALEQALVQAEKAAKGKKGDAKGEPRIIELEFRLQGAAEKPLSLDQKVEKILQEMAELRRDVNQFKGKLDGKNWQGGPWMFGPFPPKDGKDKKPGAPQPPPPPPPPGAGEFKLQFKLDEASKKRLEEMFKQLEAAKKPAKKQEPPKAADRNAELDRILERMIREVEELRQEIRKSKGAPK